MISLNGISKSYEGRQVLATLDLELKSGETSVLIGPSGCGKSTLLRIIMGLTKSDTGTARMGHSVIAENTVRELRTQIGFVTQNGGLFPHLTARENILLMPRYLDWADSEMQTRLETMTGLTHFPADGLDRYPLQLSGGQCQRVSLMRALFLDPKLLLLDEPLGALDPLIRADLQQDMKKVFEQLGKTVLLVTHDMGEAAYFGDRILLMREGRIVQDGSIQDLAHNPTDPFVTKFISAQRDPWQRLDSV